MPRSRILVVDDEAAIRDSLKMTLEYAGYEFVGAATGQEGLALELIGTIVLEGVRPSASKDRLQPARRAVAALGLQSALLSANAEPRLHRPSPGDVPQVSAHGGAQVQRP